MHSLSGYFDNQLSMKIIFKFFNAEVFKGTNLMCLLFYRTTLTVILKKEEEDYIGNNCDNPGEKCY